MGAAAMAFKGTREKGIRARRKKDLKLGWFVIVGGRLWWLVGYDEGSERKRWEGLLSGFYTDSLLVVEGDSEGLKKEARE
ncbi:hypothetical protein L1887_19831 [Cichorium endivia]|nr:hypothetical protein L1887_19831 [Cichorium endivia]